ncbi:MAG: hypothetical protein AAF681_13135 [Pseudomonadota bacterium]
MRPLIGLTAMLGLMACGTQIPDSGAGSSEAGQFNSQSYSQQQAARDAELQGTSFIPAGVISDEVTSTGQQSVASLNEPLNATGTSMVNAPAGAFGSTSRVASADPSDALARDTVAALAQTSPVSAQPLLNQSQPATAPQTVSGARGISNENSFDAVGNARSIEGDAQLIAQNRAQYQVVQPTALPSRTGSDQPNVVQYALSTNHAVGTTLYSRAGINKRARAERACAKYSSSDLAQSDFLAQGGPRRDRLGLDPDGDGFACAWNPQPFRAAVGG